MASRIGEMVVECEDPEASAAFWSAALNYRITDRDETGVAIAGHPTAPTILLIANREAKKQASEDPLRPQPDRS